MPNTSLPQTVRTRPQLMYDIFMMLIISIDLLLLTIDGLLMSGFMAQLSEWGGFSSWLSHYHNDIHPLLKLVGGLFTIFLVVELLVRWGIAIWQRSHYRWFFFHLYIGTKCWAVFRSCVRCGCCGLW